MSDEELSEITKPLYETFELDTKLSSKEALDKIIELRTQARANKDWAKSDLIRDELLKLGILLKDSKEGTTWHLK